MRFEKGHKAATRRHILDVASKCFRRDGVAAAGIAGIMGEAGLTNGAFYAHFDSKDALAREALASARADQQNRLGEDQRTGLDLEGAIRRYLHGGGICLLIVLLCLGSVCADAGVLTAPPEDLEVSLVTYGPGRVYWERFGHNAIRIRDRVSGESGDFNYGVFDFEDRAFLLNFARGHMSYMIDAELSDVNQQDYIDAGRSVLEQRLALSAEQAGRLRAFLIWNLQPENLKYEYDYLTSNCSTRIRDALNRVLGGVLQRTLVARPAPLTYRQQIDRLMAPQPLMMLPMDLGMGPSTDRRLNEWEESFLPMVLAREIRGVAIPDGRGGATPLVVREREISPNRLNPPAESAPNLSWGLGGAGLVLAVVMLASRSRFPTLSAALGVIYLTLAGLLGTILLLLWTLTTHYAAWNNANLLIFNPGAFLLLASVWRARKGAAASRLARTLMVFQIGAALIGLTLHLLPGVVQQNLPWLLFAIPVWLAIAVGTTGTPRDTP